LGVALDSLRLAQQPGALDNIPLRLGPFEKVVNLKVPVAFIIADMQGRDKIAGRTPNYSPSVNRLCSPCDFNKKDFGNHYRGCCNRLKQADVENMVRTNDQEGLAKIYQHNYKNAFFDIDFGGSPFGVFSAAGPAEGLHQLELGLMKECHTELVRHLCTPSQRVVLDSTIQSWYDYPNQLGCFQLFNKFSDIGWINNW
jgi:hypothetical protein